MARSRMRLELRPRLAQIVDGAAECHRVGGRLVEPVLGS